MHNHIIFISVKKKWLLSVVVIARVSFNFRRALWRNFNGAKEWEPSLQFLLSDDYFIFVVNWNSSILVETKLRSMQKKKRENNLMSDWFIKAKTKTMMIPLILKRQKLTSAKTPVAQSKYGWPWLQSHNTDRLSLHHCRGGGGKTYVFAFKFFFALQRMKQKKPALNEKFLWNANVQHFSGHRPVSCRSSTFHNNIVVVVVVSDFFHESFPRLPSIVPSSCIAHRRRACLLACFFKSLRVFIFLFSETGQRHSSAPTISQKHYARAPQKIDDYLFFCEAPFSPLLLFVLSF